RCTHSLHRRHDRVVSSALMAPPLILIVADPDVDCAALVEALTRQSSHEVVGPLQAVDALRFCARTIPVVLVVHVELQDISAAEFCQLIRGRANGTRVSSVLFGSSRGPRASTAVEHPPADGYISIADLPAATGRVEALARQAAEPDERPI